MGPTIGQARRAGWLLSLRCRRERAGLKSVRACPLPVVLDFNSLTAAFGPDLEVDALRTRLRCPQCGSDRYELRMHAPPGKDAGRLDAKPVPRRMQPARSRGNGKFDTLATTPDPWIVFTCPRCGRRGEYKKETLLARFDPNIQLPSLLQPFAIAAGCTLAQADRDHPPINGGPDCKIHYDIAKT